VGLPGGLWVATCHQLNDDTDPGTLASINELAIDLRETGALEEAETLFRELAAHPRAGASPRY